MKPTAKKLISSSSPMPESEWYLSQRGVKAAEKAFGSVEVKKKVKK